MLLHKWRNQEEQNFKRFLELSIICYDNGWNSLTLEDKVELAENAMNLFKSFRATNVVSDKETTDSGQSKQTSSRRKKKV
jgi:hypothetical protein